MPPKNILALLAVTLVATSLNAADKFSDTKPAGKTATTPGKIRKTVPGAASAESSEDSNEESDETDLGIPTIQTAPVDAASYKTSTLFTTASFTRSGMGECVIQVYKGNAYGIYGRQGDKRIMVAKVLLDGSAVVTLPLVKVKDTNPKQKGYTASGDNHAVYILAVDRAGYIHVCGGMHSGTITYWRSDRPEDISSFTRIMPDAKKPPGTQPCPIAGSITFPAFFSDRHGKLFWTAVQSCGALCSYDETTKLWTALGQPLGTLTKEKRSDNISFFYTDKKGHATTDTSVLKGGLSQKHFSVAWDSKDRMHMVFGMLNKNTYLGDKDISKFAHSILYAYSDDGGKTVFKSTGERIQLPILTEAGSHQGEVITSEGAGQAQIAVDKADRPMIWCQNKTGGQCFRLESGRWVDYPAAPVGTDFSPDPNGVVICKHTKRDKAGFTRFSNLDGRNSETLDLPVKGYDKEYYRDTGELVWIALSGNPTRATFTIYRTVFNGVKK